MKWNIYGFCVLSDTRGTYCEAAGRTEAEARSTVEAAGRVVIGSGTLVK